MTFKTRSLVALGAGVLFLLTPLSCQKPGRDEITRVLLEEEPTPEPEEEFDVAEVRFATDRDGMRFVPAGIGAYGCDHDYDEACGEYDVQLEIIYLEAFMIDRTEVSWGLYRECVSARVCPPNDCVPETGAGTEDRPAVCVGPEEAETFCAWSDKRLPTDVEWERAAKGLQGQAYPWGEEWCDTCLNWCDAQCDGAIDGYAAAGPVDAYPEGAGPYGALNMAGNVWELSAGFLHEEEGLVPANFVRGGGYGFPQEMDIPEDIIDYYRTTRRYPLDPETMVGPFLGFRCAADPVYD